MKRSIFSAQSVVLVGSSDNTAKPGGKILKNLLNSKIDLYLLHKESKIIQGKKTTAIDFLPKIDLAVIAVSAKNVYEIVYELITKDKCKNYLIISAGFSEYNEEGRELENNLVGLINEHSCFLIGPNCMGLLTDNFNASFSGVYPKTSKNGLEFISASGAVGSFFMEKATEYNLSFSKVVSIGNGAQLSVEDIFEIVLKDYSAEEINGKGLLLYFETIKHPDKLLENSSKWIEAGGYIAAIKAGSTEKGALAASSHTGAISTPDHAVNALFEKAGIIRCYNRRELLLMGTLFSMKLPKGNRLAVITHAGGPGVILCDTVSKFNIDIPSISNELEEKLQKILYQGASAKNPIDILATGTLKQLDETIELIENTNQFDMIAVIFGKPGLTDVYDIYNFLAEKTNNSKIPIYPVLPSTQLASKEIEEFHKNGGTAFFDEADFGETLGKFLNRPLGYYNKAVQIPQQQISSRYYSFQEAEELLKSSKINPTQFIITDKPDKSLLEKWNSVVLKAVGPLHKSDCNGVFVNINSYDEFEKRFNELMQIPNVKSVLIQPMVYGKELFVGVVYQEPFGHLIFFGFGGVFIEIINDTATLLLPVTKEIVEKKLKTLKGYPLFKGVRGENGINEEEFISLLLKISDLVEKNQNIKELDLNPIIATKDQKLEIVDFRIKL